VGKSTCDTKHSCGHCLWDGAYGVLDVSIMICNDTLLHLAFGTMISNMIGVLNKNILTSQLLLRLRDAVTLDA